MAIINVNNNTRYALKTRMDNAIISQVNVFFCAFAGMQNHPAIGDVQHIKGIPPSFNSNIHK